MLLLGGGKACPLAIGFYEDVVMLTAQLNIMFPHKNVTPIDHLLITPVDIQPLVFPDYGSLAHFENFSLLRPNKSGPLFIT